MQLRSKEIDIIIGSAKDIVIIQADNPDADSLGSSLALEAILLEKGKVPVMYCAVDIPNYLKYLKGWDRVQNSIPKKVDASIIVDASTISLLEKMNASGNQSKIETKPCIVIDHHATVDNPISFANVTINDSKMSSAGELIYKIFSELNYDIHLDAKEFIMTSILGDTQGLSNQLTTANTYRTMAELTDAGVDRSKLEEARREYSKMPQAIYEYKGQLIKRTTFINDNKIAYVIIPQQEISTYSPQYNPAPLIQSDMLLTEQVLLAIVFKTYDDGKVTAAIRSNSNCPVAGELAKQMGGGGHEFASGFKDITKRKREDIINECLDKAQKLINQS